MKNSPLKMMFLMLFLAAAMPMFAADIMPQGMTTLVESILDVFTGGFVKTILIIFLAACAVAYGFNKDNEKMKRNVLAIGIAIGIIVGAQWIVGAIWSASGR
jgi:type IV secretory pathway VirB2 component (pilin)